MLPTTPSASTNTSLHGCFESPCTGSHAATQKAQHSVLACSKPVQLYHEPPAVNRLHVGDAVQTYLQQVQHNYKSASFMLLTPPPSSRPCLTSSSLVVLCTTHGCPELRASCSSV